MKKIEPQINADERRFVKRRICVYPRSSAVDIYSLCIKIIITLILLVSTAHAIEYSANVIASGAVLSVEIDCPSEVQEKSEFTVNATITNGAENATDVIAELFAPKKAFSYSQPKKRIGEMAGNTQTVVSWNVKAKRPGIYNITVAAAGKADATGEELSAQDQETIVVSNNNRNLIDIIRSFIFGIHF